MRAGLDRAAERTGHWAEKHLILKTDGTEGPAAARDGPYRPEILGP